MHLGKTGLPVTLSTLTPGTAVGCRDQGGYWTLPLQPKLPAFLSQIQGQPTIIPGLSSKPWGGKEVADPTASIPAVALGAHVLSGPAAGPILGSVPVPRSTDPRQAVGWPGLGL